MARDSVGYSAGRITISLMIILLAGWLSWPGSGFQRPAYGMAQQFTRGMIRGRIDCSSRLLATDQWSSRPTGSFTLDKNELQIESFLHDLFQDETDGSHDELRAVLAEDLFLLPVLQQEQNGAIYVSHQPGSVTQYDLPIKFGIVGLLAHNDHSGRLFVQLKRNQKVLLIYGNGCTEEFTVTDYLKFKALNPEDPYTYYKDLRSGEELSNNQMFDLVYKGERHITFQTCIAAEGNSSWGRLFVIARPSDENPSMAILH